VNFDVKSRMSKVSSFAPAWLEVRLDILLDE
jgi:hypothetical protein